MKKLLKISFLICILQFEICNLIAQPSITWYKIYGYPQFGPYNETARCITVANNGYYFVLGAKEDNNNSAYILKINDFGDTLFSKTINSVGVIYAAVSSGDGGCVFTGNGAYTIKIDSNGNIVWQKNYNNYIVQLYDIKKTNDGGYIACGFRADSSTGYVIKLNFLGDFVWQHSLPQTSYTSSFGSVVEATNGGYVITGSDSNKILLLRTDNSGNVIWQKDYSVINRQANGLSINSVNHGYVIFGNTTDSTSPLDTKTYFIRVDTSGNVKFTKIFPFYKNDAFQYAKVINSNRYIFTTFSYAYLVNDTSFAKVSITDSLGNILHQNIFTAQNFVILHSILPLANSDIIFTGTIKNMSLEDILIIRSDSSLNAPPNGLKNISSNAPDKFNLYQNYPNPFNPVTKIKFDVGKTYNQNVSVIRILIYDETGRLIRKIFDGFLRSGTYEIEFNAENLPSGIYFYTLVNNLNIVLTRKLVLLK